MCGISGIISLNSSPILPEEIVKMTDEISHRGPDGEGFLFTHASEFENQLKKERPNALVVSQDHSQKLCFGHRRLSILDLNTSASQPMTEASGRYWIVFNGEIYNHGELRKELEKEGCKFLTHHSDTEVILNAYSKWGVDCLQRFNGMWSFCIWDKKENTFFMSRDRAGKKPLYYTENQGKLYFASEVQSLLTIKSIPRIIDDKAVYDFMTYMMVPAPNTIYKGIFKMPAAHYILFKPGEEIQLKQYWSPLNNNGYHKGTEKQIAEELRELLYESAKLRMVADVGVGVLLSGGLDSSVNLACLSKFSNIPIKAFTVGFENKDGYKNEFEYARKVAKHFNADYHELVISEKDFFDFLPEMVRFQGEPIADQANVPLYYISKIARENNVKVLLGGEGSDELFVGYQHWKIAKQFAGMMEGKPLLASIGKFIHQNSPAKNKRTIYHPWYEKVRRGQPVFWSGTELRSEKQKKDILSKEFLNKIGNYDSFSSMKDLYHTFQSKNKLDVYDWMTAADLQYRLPDLLLARLDRMMMAASVEGRNPFLDVNVIEFAMKIPPGLKTRNKKEKYILKKAFEGILPNEIIYRKKDSFTVPLSQLFKSGKYRDQSISAIDKFNKETGIFSDEFILQLKADTRSNEFWNITNLAMWHDQIQN
jgi:asparagine synthase (glutamine-hydrolysing)